MRNEFFNSVYKASYERAKHKVWIFSDLQQKEPCLAKECQDICLKDYNSLQCKSDMIWYLGDAVEGSDLNHLKQMSDMQEKGFEKLNIPLCYCIGNHDFDYALSEDQNNNEPVIPFYEMVKNHKGWFASETYEELYYKIPLGNFNIYFFNDHIARDKSWISTQGDIWGDKAKYPYFKRYEEVRNEIKADNKKIITASHYSFFGGNRESSTLSKILPLSNNVKIHFCGHAHIGDYDWARENAYRRISWINWHDISQINVSSFEHIRGQKCRSVFLHIYEDDTFGIFFRNHDDGIFSEAYFPSEINYKCKDMN